VCPTAGLQDVKIFRFYPESNPTLQQVSRMRVSLLTDTVDIATNVAIRMTKNAVMTW
jgi:hypothetical protein